jgi:hypothetical protein
MNDWFGALARYGARIVFLLSLYMLLAGLTHAFWLLGNFGMTGPSLAQQIGWVGAILNVSFVAIAPATYLFVASLFLHHLDRWAEDRAHARKRSEG